MEYCKKFRSLPKNSCAHCNPMPISKPSKKDYSNVQYPQDFGLESPITIAIQFSDHNGVEKSISFPNRLEYKNWKRENQIVKRKSFGVSLFNIRKGFMDSVNREKDQEEAMYALMKKLQRDKDREELRVEMTKKGNSAEMMNMFKNIQVV